MGTFLNWRGLHVEFPAAGYLCWFYHLTALNDRCHIPRGYVGLYHILTVMNDIMFLVGMWVSIIYWLLWMTSHSSWVCGSPSYSDCHEWHHITHGYVGLHCILTAMNDITLLMSRWVSVIYWRLSLNVYPEWLLDHIIGLTWVLKWIFKVIFIKYAAINYLTNSISGSVSFLTSPGLVFGSEWQPMRWWEDTIPA